MAKREAGENSRRQYDRGATRMLVASERRAAVARGAASPIEQPADFLAYLGQNGKLRPGTVSHYVQCARVAIERSLGPDEEAVEKAAAEARGLLKKRLNREASPRKVPSLGELGDVFSRLRWKYIHDGKDPLDLLLALYIIVMPRIGLRPVEITWTQWDGNGLYTYTAKRAGRPKRYIPHEHWPPVYKAALGLFLKLVPRELDDAAFESWRNCLASRLARASKWTRTKERLPLYFARHIAIANWKQAGITPEVIAQLAGHAGLRSQHFYASGRSGYGARYVFLDTEEARAFLGANPDAHDDADGATADTAVQEVQRPPLPKIDIEINSNEALSEPKQEASLWEDPPAPRTKEMQTSEQGERLWREHTRRADADRDRLDAEVDRIRRERAEALRESSDDARHPDEDERHTSTPPTRIKPK